MNVLRQFIEENPFICMDLLYSSNVLCNIYIIFKCIVLYLTFNPLRHSVSGANTHTENSQLMKNIPGILYDFFTYIICLEIAFTALGIGLFLNSCRIST